jgi:urease accessory protein
VPEIASPLTLSEGLLDVGLALGKGGRTYLEHRRQRFPLRLTTPLYLDPGDQGMAFLYVQNPTGGLFAGDRLSVILTAAAGTRAHLTTTASTKIHPSSGDVAESRTDLALAEGAFVEVVPDPLIPYRGSRLAQQLNARLAPGAGLVATEILAPGRAARGESFAYEEVSLLTSISDPEGRELCVDRMVFAPAVRSPARRGQLGPWAYVATVVVAAPGRDTDVIAAALDDAVRAVPGALAGAGTLPNDAGALARVLAGSGESARRAVDAAWAAARHALIDLPLPPRRK